ncbi:MAG: helix-turn-helix transcriptional regulator [Clostridia bacterium]|nr:helix-turn-helix transcriptional regulator [Clostridia bacterium]
MSFGTNLAEMRKRHGLSQEELGEKLGVSRQTIYTWESDTSAPSMDKLLGIADFFGCSVDALIRGEADTAVQSTADICKGNKEEIAAFVKGFAFKIAVATFMILIGLSAMILLEPIVGDYSIVAFFAPLTAAVALYIYAGISHSAFFSRDENKGYKSLFTHEEKSAELRRFGIILAAAVGFILLGVLLLCVLAIGNEEAVFPAALFLAMVAVSVFFIIYASIPLSKYYDEKEENLDEEGRKRYALAEAINAVLWMVTVAVYLLLGFLGGLWHPGWIVFVVTAFASGIVEVACGVKKE